MLNSQNNAPALIWSSVKGFSVHAFRSTSVAYGIMDLGARKPVSEDFDHIGLKHVCSATETSYSTEIWSV